MSNSAYRRVVWSRVKADVGSAHTPLHLFWGIVPLVAGALIGLFFARRWEASTFSLFTNIGIPLITVSEGCFSHLLPTSDTTAYLALRGRFGKLTR